MTDEKEVKKVETPVATLENKTQKTSGFQFKDANFTMQIGSTVYSNANLTKKTVAALEKLIPGFQEKYLKK